MPRTPTFNHYEDVPFDISWNETAALWELDLPENMPSLDLPVVLSDRYVPGREIFYFGHRKLQDVCTVLQGYLDSLRAKISERLENLPEYEILHIGSGHIQVLGPDLDFIAERLRLAPSRLSRGMLVLTGVTAERKLSAIRDYLTEMGRYRNAPEVTIEGLYSRHMQQGTIGHVRLRGPLVEPLVKILAGTKIRFTADRFGTLVLERKDLPAVEDLAKKLLVAAEARRAEIKAAISEPDFIQKLPSWAQVSADEGFLCLVYPADLVKSSVRVGMRNRGITRSLWDKNQHNPSCLHWAIDIQGDTSTAGLLSSVLEAIRFLETKRREEERAMERQLS